MKKQGLSPLGRYLLREDIKQHVFAERLAMVRGVSSVPQSEISAWATGARDPVDATIVAIETASHGKVKRSSWPCWRRRNREARAS
jgi:hypothetical protein